MTSGTSKAQKCNLFTRRLPYNTALRQLELGHGCILAVIRFVLSALGIHYLYAGILHGSFGDLVGFLSWLLKISYGSGSRKGKGIWNGLFLLAMLLPTVLPLHKMYTTGKVDALQVMVLLIGLTLVGVEIVFLCGPSANLSEFHIMD